MARRVYHYSECGNFYSYYREHGVVPKTHCGRDMTGNYFFVANPDQVTCSRCKKKLEKEGRLRGQSNGAPIVINRVRDIGSCGDDAHDLYLQRLGIG